MAATSALQIAKWVIAAGFTGPADRVKAVEIALARGADPGVPGGLWGVGGADGPAQAAAAFTQFKQSGWNSFPDIGTGRAVLYYPIALAAVNEAKLLVTVSPSNIAAATGNPTAQALTNGTALQEPLAVVHFLTTPNAWNRILKIGAGIMLLGIGSGLVTYENVAKPLINGANVVGQRVYEASLLTGRTGGGGRGGGGGGGGGATPAPAPRPRPRPPTARPTTTTRVGRRDRSGTLRDGMGRPINEDGTPR